MSDERVLDIPSAAARLNVHPRTLERMIAAREIASTKTRRRRGVPVSAIDRYIAAHTILEKPAQRLRQERRQVQDPPSEVPPTRSGVVRLFDIGATIAQAARSRTQ